MNPFVWLVSRASQITGPYSRRTVNELIKPSSFASKLLHFLHMLGAWFGMRIPIGLKLSFLKLNRNVVKACLVKNDSRITIQIFVVVHFFLSGRQNCRSDIKGLVIQRIES